jgi:hypothetical protein
MTARAVWKVDLFEVLMCFDGIAERWVDAKQVIRDSVRLMMGDTSSLGGRFLSSFLTLYAFEMPDSVAQISKSSVLAFNQLICFRATVVW